MALLADRESKLLIDGKEVAVSYGSTISYSWSTTTTAKKGAKATSTGSSTLTVRAQDAAGNVGSASVTVQKK